MTSQLQSLLKEKINANIKAHGLADKEFAEFDSYQSGKIEKIPVDKIKPNNAQPRLEFADESLDKLADSINELGLLQPISVQKKGDFYNIVAGERRFRAVKRLGKQFIDCIIITVTNENNALLALAENLSRENLSDYEIAKAIISFKSNFPSKTQYAKALGISRQKLYKLFAFEILDNDLLAKLDNHPNIISADTIEQLATLRKHLNIPPDEFLPLLSEGFDLIISNHLKQSKLPDFIKNKANNSLSNQHPTNTKVRKSYKKEGKTIGKIIQTDKKFIVELESLNLNEADLEKVEVFFDNLLSNS